MKKYLLIMAVAALALTSCSSDETIAVNQSDAISFRPLVNNLTRTANGAGLKASWETGDVLHVYADYNGAKLFQDDFTKESSGGFNSSTKHYWPTDISSSKKVTFTAFWGAAQKSWTAAGDENKLAAKYTVDNDVTKQMDLLIAKKEVSAKPAAGAGVELNFRHMLSQIAVKVVNNEANMKITVTGVRIGYVSNAGTFTYSGGVTDQNTTDNTNSGGATLVARTDWSTDVATNGTTSQFDQSVTATALTGVTAATSLTDFKPYILMPQQLIAASDYSTRESSGAVTTATAPTLNNAYIALKMAIEETSTSAPLLAEQWCYWPIDTEWKPGYKYTYVVDASQGGYQPTDQDNTTGLDPVFGGSYIWFTPSCTIDAWVDANYGVSMPVARTVSYAFANATNQTIYLNAGENGDFTIILTGLTTGKSLSASATGNFTPSPTVTDNLDGTYTLTGTLSANGPTAVYSVITINNTSDVESMTITIVQPAP